MQVIADTHVHIYPQYKLERLLASAFKNLKNLAPSSAFRAIFLTENKSHKVFSELDAAYEPVKRGGFVIDSLVDESVIKINSAFGDELYVVNGRQYISKEGIEVLSLVDSFANLDGKNLRTIIDAILADDGVPVLSWSPGKWLGKRGSVVQEFVARTHTVDFLLGDISMRAGYFKLPQIMRFAESRKIRILAGTDPLPIKGDERIVGSYGSLFEVDDKWSPSAQEFKHMLRNAPFTNIGKRNNLPQAMSRWVRARIAN